MRATTSNSASSGIGAGKSSGPRLDLPPIAGKLAVLREHVTRADGTRETQVVRAPFTGDALGEIPLCGADDVTVAIERGRLAQRAWAGVSMDERCRVLTVFHDLLLDSWDEALDLVQLETGKARRHAVEELTDIALVARYYASVSPGLLGPKKRAGAIPGLTRTREYRQPHGVVGVIVPWNYPLSLAISDCVPAIVAGNAVVVKPDVQTSHSALWALSLWRQAGLPVDVFQVVTGDGPGTGGALVDAVDYLSFTGSTETGKTVARKAAERLIGCSLELGGKNPMIVRADADLKKAVAGAVRGSFANAGQLCISMERIYVHAGLYDRFVEAFVERTEKLRLRTGFDFDADIGSLISEAQLRKVQYHADDALVEGATVEVGGRARPDVGPFFFEPAILSGVTDGMLVAREETFGPVVSVHPFPSDDEAVELANATCYGLNASVWTQDIREGVRMARRIEAGTVNVNEAFSAAWGSVDAPMGGFKESGLGRRHGAEGLLKFTESQTVAVQRGLSLDLASPRLGSARYQKMMRRLLKNLHRVPGMR
jgi:acyl-CoA reductase-like NAD-dependent aldehyde dehydrogenase